MDEELIRERERHQIEQIRQLEFEELQVEEVESMRGSDSDDSDPDNIAAAGRRGGFTFDAGLASLHTYLGEVEDTHHGLSFLEGGASLNVPLFYLEGVVLFPGATLPLRVVDSNFIMAAERTISQIDMSFVIGVIHVYMNPADGRMAFGRVGTTAEIRQYRRLDDGSVNMVTHGKQRFRLKKRWSDVDNIIWAEIQIIEEDFPLRTPRDVFGTLPLLTGTSSKDLCHQKLSTDSPATPTPITTYKYNDSEEDSDESFQDYLSVAEKRLHESAISSRCTYSYNDQSISSDDERDEFELEGRSCARSSDSISGASQSDYEPSTSDALGIRRRIRIQPSELKQGTAGKVRWAPVVNHSREVSTAFWPYWVYRKYDSYYLARRAADMWKKIVGAPSMDSLAREPDTLSFHIGSKIPASVSTRQELLEIDGISYRLRREIELLECFDRVRCKICRTTIARRSDMMVMSSDGPLGAYVNPHGYVHETMTFLKASGLALIGRPVREYSWFPGYAWTIANCATCESHMGWLFTAAKSKLQPESFWGIRCSQVGDEMR
ncbi:hypothetical protein Droror1_Dr00017150 [Drosera rotundifolia]